MWKISTGGAWFTPAVQFLWFCAVYLRMIKIRRFISILLLASFLPILVPRELVHNLFGHDDTQDHYHAAITIEKAHKHCRILQVTFSTFISHLKNIIPEKKFTGSFYCFTELSFIPSISVNLSSLRAPPSLISWCTDHQSQHHPSFYLAENCCESPSDHSWLVKHEHK